MGRPGHRSPSPGRPSHRESEAHQRQAPAAGSGVVALAQQEPPAKAGNSLIEFSTVAREDPNEGVVFGETPAHCKCPHCERSVITFIDHEASWVTWLLGFMVWFSLGWMMAFVILPLLWPAFKDVVHHCPRCLNVIARKSRISLPTFRTEIMTFKIGGCAVVLARKYVAILVGLLLTIIVVYLLRSTVHLNQVGEIQKGPPSMLTWEDFLFDCGPRTSLRHRTSTVRAFEERFRRRTFKWQGEVRMIREGFDILFFHTKNVVMLKMYPQRFPRRDLPDVALLFGDERNAEVATLSPGDWVEFEATMTAHGFRGDPEVMTLWHIAAAPKPSPLSSSAGASHGHGEVGHGHDAASGEEAAAAPEEDAAGAALQPADDAERAPLAKGDRAAGAQPQPEKSEAGAQAKANATQPHAEAPANATEPAPDATHPGGPA